MSLPSGLGQKVSAESFNMRSPCLLNSVGRKNFTSKTDYPAEFLFFIAVDEIENYPERLLSILIGVGFVHCG